MRDQHSVLKSKVTSKNNKKKKTLTVNFGGNKIL